VFEGVCSPGGLSPAHASIGHHRHRLESSSEFSTSSSGSLIVLHPQAPPHCIGSAREGKTRPTALRALGSSKQHHHSRARIPYSSTNTYKHNCIHHLPLNTSQTLLSPACDFPGKQTPRNAENTVQTEQPAKEKHASSIRASSVNCIGLREVSIPYTSSQIENHMQETSKLLY